MKKLILTSATVLFIGLTAFAQDGGKCDKKCAKGNECKKECSKDGVCNKKCGMNECTADMKCNKDNANCKKNCKMGEVKKASN